MAPAISAGFAASIFMLIKVIVHIRKNPVPWAVYTSPFFFLIAGTICTLSIVYKGSPNLGLNKKPSWYVASVTMGTGGGLCLLAIIFFVPVSFSARPLAIWSATGAITDNLQWLRAKIMKKDYTVTWWMVIYGHLLWNRPTPPDAEQAKVPNYAVVQKDPELDSDASQKSVSEYDAGEGVAMGNEKNLVITEAHQVPYKELMAQGQARFHAKLRRKRGPLGWAMRTLHDNPMGAGEVSQATS